MTPRSAPSKKNRAPPHSSLPVIKLRPAEPAVVQQTTQQIHTRLVEADDEQTMMARRDAEVAWLQTETERLHTELQRLRAAVEKKDDQLERLRKEKGEQYREDMKDMLDKLERLRKDKDEQISSLMLAVLATPHATQQLPALLPQQVPQGNQHQHRQFAPAPPSHPPVTAPALHKVASHTHTLPLRPSNGSLVEQIKAGMADRHLSEIKAEGQDGRI